MRSLMVRMAGYAAALVLVLSAVPETRADVIVFVGNPTGNSIDFRNFVLASGGTINSNVNWSTHPVGPLQNNFYSATEGVTFSTTGPINTVMFGPGPGQAGRTPPLSDGEGPHPASNFLFANAGPPSSTLTITFANAILGAGLFTIDLFNPNQGGPSNDLTIQAFTGPDGTGTLLGTFHAAEFNFQPNNLYFMGIASTDANIRSIRLNDPATLADEIGIGTILIGSPVPEPSTLTLLGFAALGLLGYGWRTRKRPAHARDVSPIKPNEAGVG